MDQKHFENCIKSWVLLLSDDWCIYMVIIAEFWGRFYGSFKAIIGTKKEKEHKQAKK